MASVARRQRKANRIAQRPARGADGLTAQAHAGFSGRHPGTCDLRFGERRDRGFRVLDAVAPTEQTPHRIHSGYGCGGGDTLVTSRIAARSRVSVTLTGMLCTNCDPRRQRSNASRRHLSRTSPKLDGFDETGISATHKRQDCRRRTTDGYTPGPSITTGRSVIEKSRRCNLLGFCALREVCADCNRVRVVGIARVDSPATAFLCTATDRCHRRSQHRAIDLWPQALPSRCPRPSHSPGTSAQDCRD